MPTSVGMSPRHKQTSDLFLFQDRNGLAAGETTLDLVPISDVILTQLPAKADVVPAMATQKIDQAGLIILQLAPHLVQLVHVILKQLDGVVQFPLLGGLVPLLGGCQIGLKGGHLIMRFDDIADDPLDQRQSAIRLGQLKSFGGP